MMPEPNASAGPRHRWRFFRVGGLDLVRLERAEDLRNLPHLDQKLWSALACPVKGLELDENTLALIDTDRDGRIRAPEVVAAVRWICSVLRDPAAIVSGSDAIELSAIADEALLASAREVLSSRGEPEATRISLADVADLKSIFARRPFNGDGVIGPEAADTDAATRQVLLEIMAVAGSTPDRSGEAGVTAAEVATFFDALTAFEAWTAQGEAQAAQLFPLGADTAAAAGALAAVRAKVDDYFARCRLAAFDSRAETALNGSDGDLAALAGLELTSDADVIAELPLARVAAQPELPLDGRINPAWAGRVAAVREKVVAPLLGGDRSVLTEAEWSSIQARFAPYEQWQAGKTGAIVEPLGIARVRELLASDARARIDALLAREQEAAPRFAAISDLERLLRYHRDLYRLLMNFVSLADFYSPDRMAVFQAGVLFLDARACELVVTVADPARHATMAALSSAYLAYCDCTRPATGEKMQIVAAFTNGDSDHLMVGRNGIFYDRRGRDWDATIVKVIENPISIRQAFWAPYKRFVRWLEEQAAKRAAAADAAAAEKMTATATAAAAARPGEPPAPKTPERKRIDVGTVAALGVALGSIGTFASLVLVKFIDLGIWIPLGLIGLMLLISGPSMIIAALKLHKRTLGPILDANGWAMNGRVRINIPFGTSLTEIANLPPGARRSLDDPYRGRRALWPWIVLLVVLLALAFWIRWDHNRRGHYFWEPSPAQVESEIPPEEPAAAPAPETGSPQLAPEGD